MNFYITADEVGAATGGGKVTANEYAAFQRVKDNVLLLRPSPGAADPFAQDRDVLCKLQHHHKSFVTYGHAHFYAGCFSETCAWLKSKGCKISYTVAAHDVNDSRRAHEAMGWPFPYPHLTDSGLFACYIAGYRDYADVVICPSEHSASVVRSQGRSGRVVVIEHGVDLPTREPAHAENGAFSVGYMGAIGPDKGLPTLFRAWAEALPKLPAGAHLILAGKHSSSTLCHQIAKQSGFAGCLVCMGWVDDIADFFTHVDLYVQPSATEGFGIEVLEAMAHGVPVACSTGAGASELVDRGRRFMAGDVGALSRLIVREAELKSGGFPPDRKALKASASHFTWDRIQKQYAQLWETM